MLRFELVSREEDLVLVDCVVVTVSAHQRRLRHWRKHLGQLCIGLLEFLEEFTDLLVCFLAKLGLCHQRVDLLHLEHNRMAQLGLV